VGVNTALRTTGIYPSAVPSAHKDSSCHGVSPSHRNLPYQSVLEEDKEHFNCLNANAIANNQGFDNLLDE
jgi:hypothetical protein